jgi:hypothetical protein
MQRARESAANKRFFDRFRWFRWLRRHKKIKRFSGWGGIGTTAVVAVGAIGMEVDGAFKTAAAFFFGAWVTFAFAVYVSDWWDKYRKWMQFSIVAVFIGSACLFWGYLPRRPQHIPAPSPRPAQLVLDTHRVSFRATDDVAYIIFALTIRNEGDIGTVIKSWKLTINSVRGQLPLDPGHPSSDMVFPEGDFDLKIPTHSQDLLDRVEAVTRDNPAAGVLTFEITGNFPESEFLGSCLALTGVTVDGVSFGEPCLQVGERTEPIHVPGLKEQLLPRDKKQTPASPRHRQ